jgi:hypothetical protein
MKAALTTIPKTTDDAFQNILERIEQDPNTATTARRALTWCYYTRRPLDMEELRQAIVIEDEDGEPRGEENAGTIVDCCLSFIAHDLTTLKVGFIHPSVQRWFEREPQNQKLFTHTYLAKTCLTYLNFYIFDVVINDDGGYSDFMDKYIGPYPFYRYAAQFWGDHTRGEAEKDRDIQRAVLSLLASENKKDSMLQMETYANSNQGKISFTKGQTLLHVIAKNGLATICNRVLSRRINGNDTYVLEVDI